VFKILFDPDRNIYNFKIDPGILKQWITLSNAEFPNYNLDYFSNYLSRIGCVFIIEEEKYVDKQYLQEYLNFYGSTYDPPERYCKRLHFFNEKFQLNLLDIGNYDSKSLIQLQSSYLGFMVIKPIPNMVGKTCLKPYDDINDDSFFGDQIDTQHIITLKDYRANLRGIPLKIKSIAFQQQDTVISACATTALWVCLQKTNYEFGYYSPTPFELKNISNDYANKRPFPSAGLNFVQIIKTIQSYGLDVEVSSIKTQTPYVDFLAFFYAYLRGGFPIFLGVKNDTDQTHALAIVGYKLSRETPELGDDLPLTGSRLNKLYIHDDNIGPFSMYDITIDKTKDDKRQISLTSHEYGNFYPIYFVIPIYNKIRYPFSKIQTILEQLLSLIKTNFPSTFESHNYEWDSYITTVNDYKTSVLGSVQEFYTPIKEKILKEDLPRFIWRSVLKIDNKIEIELLSDATEALNRFPCKIITLSIDIKDPIRKLIQKIREEESFDYPTFPGLRQFLVDNLI